jgi:hypothetical protein
MPLAHVVMSSISEIKGRCNGRLKAHRWSRRMDELAGGSPALTVPATRRYLPRYGRWKMEGCDEEDLLARACQDSEEGVGEVVKGFRKLPCTRPLSWGSTSDWSKLPVRISVQALRLQPPGARLVRLVRFNLQTAPSISFCSAIIGHSPEVQSPRCA